jgi:hypothetical protein
MTLLRGLEPQLVQGVQRQGNHLGKALQVSPHQNHVDSAWNKALETETR